MKISHFPVLSALLVSAILGCAPTDDETPTFFPDAPANPDKAKLLDLLNEFRSDRQTCGGQSIGPVGSITWNDTLALVAKQHSLDMDANDQLNHVSTDGSFVDDRIAAMGYEFSFYAENLLKGGENEEKAIMAWIQSAAHCENLMAEEALEIGVGTAGPYWTMVLASH
jgi:uncharacterized protein YkwD